MASKEDTHDGVPGGGEGGGPVEVAPPSQTSRRGRSPSKYVAFDDFPAKIAEGMYEAVCRDSMEKPSQKGLVAFRDVVFEKCSPTEVVLRGMRIGPRGVSALMSTLLDIPDVPTERLILSNNSVGNDGIGALVDSLPQLKKLSFIDLSLNGIRSMGVATLSRYLAQSACNLVWLDLSSSPQHMHANVIDAGSLKTLASALFPGKNRSLQGLVLRGNSLQQRHSRKLTGQGTEEENLSILNGHQGGSLFSPTSQGSSGRRSGRGGGDAHGEIVKACEAVANMLMRNRTLTHLDMSEMGLGTRGCALVTSSLARNSHLRHLYLSGNGAGPDLGSTLAVVLARNSSLVSLYVDRNKMRDGVGNIAEALSHHNKPGGPSVQEFTGVLVKEGVNSTLCVLDVSHNEVGDDAVVKLGHALSRNSTLIHLNLSHNRITEKGGQALAFALIQNPVLAHLSLSHNPVGNPTAIAMAEALVTNESLEHFDLSSCKVGDEGMTALVSAIGNNTKLALRKLRLRDNYITGRKTGDLVVDALFRSRSLVVADFRGNQLDHVRLSKIKAICRRNLAEIRDEEPRRLRKEIARLRGEKIKLRKAEATLERYQSSIKEIRAQIAQLEEEKRTFLAGQNERRREIRSHIEKERVAIKEAEAQLEQKKEELNSVETTYKDRIQELQVQLDKEIDARKKVEGELSKVKGELEKVMSEKPGRVSELKSSIKQIKEEKSTYQQQLLQIRTELSQLQKAYQEKQPISELIEQAKALLERTAHARSTDTGGGGGSVENNSEQKS